MSSGNLTKLYPKLTARERFLLVEAAVERGDHIEIDRLERSASHVEFSAHDHQPYLTAFRELCLTTYIELSHHSGLFRDMMMNDIQRRYDWIEESLEDRRTPNLGQEQDPEFDHDGKLFRAHPIRKGESQQPEASDLIRATGYVFRQLMRGWVLFCRQLGTPPFSRWKQYPGFDRMKSLLRLSRTLSFSHEEMTDWLKRTGSQGAGEVTNRITAREKAKLLMDLFETRVRCFGGEVDPSATLYEEVPLNFSVPRI